MSKPNVDLNIKLHLFNNNNNQDLYNKNEESLNKTNNNLNNILITKMFKQLQFVLNILKHLFHKDNNLNPNLQIPSTSCMLQILVHNLSHNNFHALNLPTSNLFNFQHNQNLCLPQHLLKK